MQEWVLVNYEHGTTQEKHRAPLPATVPKKKSWGFALIKARKEY
jgi:hypothetical protein